MAGGAGPAFPPAATGRIAGRSFPHQDRFYSAFYTFEGWPANQSLGMLITKRMEASADAAGLCRQ
jgi:hypothetical protein